MCVECCPPPASTSDPDPEHTPSVCLIVAREMLIAQDLAMMIGDARPDLQVRCAITPDAALQQLTGDVPLVLAMVDVPPDAFSASALAARVAASQAMLIYLGHDGPVQDKALHIRALPYPFGLDDVLGILSALPMKTAPGSSAGG